jgi:hypothetical protein
MLEVHLRRRILAGGDWNTPSFLTRASPE